MSQLVRNSLRRRLTWLRGREEGSATVEFVIIFPAIMMLLLMSVEVGVMMARGMMLDRGIDVSMRTLRLGQLTPMSHDNLKNEICRNSLIIPDCEDVLAVELRPITTAGWAPTTNRPVCLDRSEDIQPVLQFQAGVANQLMLVSACAKFKPFFPTTGLAATTKTDGAGEYAMIATSAYVNEP